MSDTSNTANLASAPLAGPEEFDARLKRTDENRWLATRYAPPEGRERLVAIYLLNQELQRTLHTKESMLGKIRIQWWRETIEQVFGKAPLRRHDLAEELARVTRNRPDLIVPINDLIDRFDDIIDDHLHGGHTEGGAHEARHLAVEGALAGLAGRSLDDRASEDEFRRIAALAEAALALKARLDGADAQWKAACLAVRSVRSQLWPAILGYVLQGSDEASPLAKRWRMFRAALVRKL